MPTLKSFSSSTDVKDDAVDILLAVPDNVNNSLTVTKMTGKNPYIAQKLRKNINNC